MSTKYCTCERDRELCRDCRDYLKERIGRQLALEGPDFIQRENGVTHFVMKARTERKEPPKGGTPARPGFWRTLCRRIECWMGLHHWTCAAALGIPPTKEQLNGGVTGFWDYARMFCEDCGKEAGVSRRNWEQSQIGNLRFQRGRRQE